MHAQPISVLILAALAFFPPAFALGSRTAPEPVPPVVWQGVEYRAPLDLGHMGHVQAFDTSSGRMLWETEVYHVPIDSREEQDVQWVFVSGMAIQDGKLVVQSEDGKVFRLDPATGQADVGMRDWLPWAMGGIAVVGLVILCCWAWRRRGQRMAQQ